MGRQHRVNCESQSREQDFGSQFFCRPLRLSETEAFKEGYERSAMHHNVGVHVELSTDNLDGLYEELRARGVEFKVPPHDEPWERSATALDPDGYSVEFSQGRRGKNQTG